MFFFRLFIILFILFLKFYYILVVLQLCGVVKFTKQNITIKGLIPFYYFIK